MKNLYLLPTDISRLHLAYDNEWYVSNEAFSQLDTCNYKSFNIYITSDEEITNCDCYVINVVGEISRRTVFKPIKVTEDIVRKEPLITYPNGGWCKKIILTTDQDLIKDGVQEIDDEFLEWFVKNPSCEEVEVKDVYFHGSGYYDANQLSEQEKSLYSSMKEYKIIIPNLEIWKDVPEFEGYYQVSNLGNVKSLSRTILGRGKHNTLLKERLLKFSTSTNGYYQVILQKEGFKKIYKVHSLVAVCFLNHIPDGTHNVVIDHINEIKMDNRLENLRLIGHRENVSRSMKNNTSTYVGVSWSKNAKKWISQITIEGKTKYLGLFDNEEDANKKYLETLKNL